jgi:hypothetical protein
MKGVLIDRSSNGASLVFPADGSYMSLNHFLSAAKSASGAFSLRVSADGITIDLPRSKSSSHKSLQSSSSSSSSSRSNSRNALTSELSAITSSLETFASTFEKTLSSPLNSTNKTTDLSLSDSAPLKLSSAVLRASGRYKPPVFAKSDSTRVQLHTIAPAEFDEYIKSYGGSSEPLMVCAWAVWMTRSTALERVWQEANGSGTFAGRIAKFDASGSPFLRERYGLRLLPAFLIYVKGRLVYASNALEGLEASVDVTKDSKPYRAAMHEQMEKAKRAAPLPDSFRFSAEVDGSLQHVMRSYENKFRGFGMR